MNVVTCVWKKLLVFLFAIFTIGFAFSQNPKKLNFEISPTIGIEWGNWGEYIYAPKEDYLLSYLNWESKPIFKTCIDFGIFYQNFSLGFSTTCGFPAKKNGTMFDSDWNGDGIKYIYSENELYSGFAFDAGITAGYNFQKNIFTFLPMLSVEYSNYFFTAKDGQGWYGDAPHSLTHLDVPYNSEAAKYYPHISGYSTYEIHNLYSFAGFQIVIAPIEKLLLSLQLNISPYTYTYTQDVHYRKSGIASKYVLAEQNIFFKRFKIGFSGKYKITKTIQLNAGATCIFGSHSYGKYLLYLNDSIIAENFFPYQKGKSASDIFVFDIMSGICFRF